MKSNYASKKMNKFRTSPFMISIAIVEVIILICVSTYAWFAITERDSITAEFIGVEPNSGLEIDFSDASEDGAVDINRYITDFCFEPVTSLDGRNIFVPTTGTFNNTDTGNISFREATVNDMNSKYINVDFTLTNTAQEEMPVYLSSKSTFTYDLGDGNTSEGKALRIAFYQNDGNSGAVDNDLVDKEEDSDTPGGDDQSQFFIFFKNNLNLDWGNIRCEHDRTANFGYQNGQPMKYDEKSGFYYLDVTPHLSEYNTLNYLKFRNNKSSDNQPQTTQINGSDNIKFNSYYYQFKSDGSTDGNNNYYLDGPIEFKSTDIKPDVSTDTTTSSTSTTTVYFQNTRNWETPYIHIWDSNNKTPNDTTYPGVKMTKIAGNLYYHSFESKYTNVVFSEGKSATTPNREQSVDVTGVKSGYIYYLTDLDNSNNSVYSYKYDCYLYESSDDGDGYPVISPGVSAGFQRSYAPVLSINNASGKSTNIVPAFASSIDNYSFASGKPLFTIKKNETKTMSMIIWLEGTDEDCTGDNYLGKNIDLNLIFATKDNADELYTYKFIDATRETWLDDDAFNDSGIKFKPVMQLYDFETGKGYLMKLGKDGKTWSCKAPNELQSSKHIAFRRVNPLDETMVWNFWDTFGFNDYTSAVSEVIDEKEEKVIYFTAFSDGAPYWDSVKTNPKQASIKNENLPERSCGGLWGKYETGTMYVFDGTPTRWIKGSESDDTIDGTTGVLTINYELNNQRIEYKASADNSKGMYYFVVPLEVCDTANANRPTVLIKRYYDFFEGLALNDVTRNKDIKFHKMWAKSKSDGWLYQINSAGEEQDSYGNGYWGNDMLYIEAVKNNNFDILADNAKIQVKFFKDSYESSTNFYSYLYENSEFKGTGGATYGFACVIPSQGNYNCYTVERCDQNGSVWNRTHTVSDSISYSGNSSPYSVTAYKNICKLVGYQSDNDFYIVNECYNDADVKP